MVPIQKDDAPVYRARYMPGERLAGKVAIVTGAGSRAPGGIGNGRATAVLFAREGARVALVDTVTDWVAETLDMIEREGGQAFVIQADVTDPPACQDIVQRTVEHYGKLDILVNNVGINGPRGTALDVDPDDWDRAMRVNVKSMMLMAKYAIPEMVRSGGGAIVNLGSVAGLMSGNPNLMYTASKGAVVQMTRAMAAHHAGQGIRVNCVAPGMVYTPMVYAGGMGPAQREARRMRSLLQTEGTGWDIGYAILFLASDEARWITGAVLPVDAGATAGKNMESPDTFYAAERSST
jgi:NAD(P)-dependent dehydrogenase (short-subunit alcohol dehydrogenase family)